MERLKLLRKEFGLTQEQLGSVLGLAGNTITGYERGERFPDIETLKNMAEYFHVSVDYLIGITDVREPAGVILSMTEESELLYKLSSVPAECREALKTLIIHLQENKK